MPSVCSEETLQKWVEDQSLRYFHRPFVHRAHWNWRLRTTGGRYYPKTHDLDFNPKMLAYHGKETFLAIIRHELCHYHLYLTNGGYHHRDRDFKQLLQQVNGLRYAPPLPAQQVKYTYQCRHCHQMYPRQRRVNTARYRCGRCGGELALR
ncbi:MAG: SprT family protein [Aerococcus sp.]|nr:SprT family protein [Aerococcus sp.]